MIKRNVQLHVKTVFKASQTNSSVMKSLPHRVKSMKEQLRENKFEINTTTSTKVQEIIRVTKESKIVNWGKLFSRDFEFKLKQTKTKTKKCPSQIKAVLFDINNVLLGFDKEALASIGKDLKMILKNGNWMNYLNGSLTKEEAVGKISQDLNFSTAYIEKVIEETRKSFIPIQETIFYLQKLKEEGKMLICLSNCPKDEIDLVRRRFSFFDEFDMILSSGDIGVNKPDQKAFHYVLNYCNLQPEEVCYIDDDGENVKAAGEVGIRGVQFTDLDSIKEIDKIINTKNESNVKLEEKNKSKPVSKYSQHYAQAYEYLTKYADLDDYGLFVSTVGLGEKLQNKQSPSEIFATVLVLTTSKQVALSPVGNRILSFLKKNNDEGRFKFFNDLDVIPYDVDDTSLSTSLLYKHGLFNEKTVHSVIDKILANHNEDHILLTFFDEKRYRLCPIVCANALFLIHQAGREDNLIVRNTKQYIFDFLASKDYTDGCTYYPNPDFYLYTIAKLVYMFPQHFAEFEPVLIKEVNSRIGQGPKSNVISLASRVICSKLFDIPNKYELDLLISQQLADGSWTECPIYTTSKKKNENIFSWSNRALSTAFGMKAVELEMFGKKHFL